MNPEIAQAAHLLIDLAHPLGLSPILIGALASEAAPDRPDGAPSFRITLDADFALRVPDWTTYDTLMAAVVRAGHRRDRHVEHRVYIRDIMIDIVPFGRRIVPDGRLLVWPASGFLMDVTGLEEAAGNARETEVAPGIRLSCITLPAFILLKTSAYLDRQRKGDIKHKSDAEDILFWFHHYASGNDDGPRYEMMQVEPPLPMDYTTAGAAALGRDVARLASPAARQRVGEFILHARPEDSPFWNVLYRPLLTAEESAKALDEGLHLLEAFAWACDRPETGMPGHRSPPRDWHPRLESNQRPSV